ncbi:MULTISPECIES: ABC transporter ATP-binding protein [unclassified Thomasclavelia]|uniref:ABC transporter ATP-binding protein n=1 Tax=unclassified Thomasclavelia TaxID=3025756 RepID=UPI000B38E456|nr:MULTISPECIES: ABC transporter ATP-binding protein [unclassified Thomasclavelia]OUQ08606.1 ABC transporter [Erysipelatoclostridium sp. An15]
MVKTLFKQIKQYKKDSLLTIFFVVVEVILEILIPLFMAHIIDDGISNRDINAVYKYGLIMFVIAIGTLSTGFLAGKYAAKASTGFAANLRDAMYTNIQSFSFSNIDKYSTAGLVTRLTTDVTNVQMAYQMIIRMCIRAPMNLICALTMAFMINGDLSLIFVGAMIFLIVVLGFIMVTATRYFNQVFPKYDDLNESVQENVVAIRAVKSFVREDYENNKFKKAAQNIYKLFVKAEAVLALNNPAMMLSVYGCILLLSWLGAQSVVGGSLTTGELTTLFSYIMNILMSLMMLSMAFVMITMSIASGRRIAEVINEKSDLVSPESALTTVENGAVDFNHVTFSYKHGTGEPVLRDIDLHIKSGETIGIIGGTGSAKSSLVNLISRLYDVDRGSVLVGGQDVRKYDLEVLRNEVAVVLQNNVLFSGTILQNLRWGNENATLEECEEACRLACADEFIQKFPDKYNTYIEQGGTNVSGGQKQRLCIARALLKKPKILILDDSTSAVDTATDASIQQSFEERIPDTTKIIISQRVSSVQSADRIIVLNDGIVDAFAPHEELLETNEIYRMIYETQTKGKEEA